jgi:hypothetical protein
VRFLWTKGLNAKDIHKEMFTVGRVCGVKRFSLGGKRFADDEEVETEMRKWLRQQPKDFYVASFDAPVKRLTSVSMLVEDMSRNICFFPGSNIIFFYVLYIFVTYLLTLPCAFNRAWEVSCGNVTIS